LAKFATLSNIEKCSEFLALVKGKYALGTYEDSLLTLAPDEPETFKQAMESTLAKEWKY
jgi:hypothetical protein